MKINAVDLFCGIGGLTYGLQKAGINVIAGIDIVEKCRYAYEKNNNTQFIQADLKKTSYKEIENLYPKDTDVKVLAGCAPCQPFSSYSYRYKNTDSTNKKMDLLDYFGEFVTKIKPDIVSMENVPQLSKEPIFKKFIKTLENNNYKVTWNLVYAPAYGVPQNRKRLVLLASKIGNIKLMDPPFTKEAYPDVYSAIGKLPPIHAGEYYEKDKLHHSARLNSKNLERIKQSRPGGTWKDWDEKLLLACHKKKSGNTYRSVYGRMEWHKPSPTITTQFYGYGNGRFGHPEQNRAISLREGALLQTFPRNYDFGSSIEGKKVNMREIATQIGNAVPVKLAYYIGKSITQAVR
ncbi:DNA cytosine methyltransferase [Pediococcus acidilactici]|uniref:Cytosine-specific methyltransferase n=1 Tax=Pediococcus acidilactici TaxID=1254 RepID=A0AAW8YMI0_PEDAC|nr:DNA cytosine methyltransferase [Pediococcus acidilactici]MDV2911066.1 DNA cytosine methyltransferase [Pediococcus acidilactici]WQS17610.1 DNA cytosine methyltransferase [Pediococcus acidilactici]